MFYSPRVSGHAFRLSALAVLSPFAIAAFYTGGCTGSDTVDPNFGNGPGGTTNVPGTDSGGGGQVTPPGTDGGGPPITYDATPPPPFDAGQSDGKPAQDAECDLNGRWLVAQRVLASAIGQDQAAHNWFYYEIRHEGADLVVLKGLHCGYEVIKKTSLSAAVDSSGAWASFLEHDTSTGRTGTYVKEGSSCHLTLAKEYVVRGATVAYYDNPSNPLPGKADQANGSTPGWEDWDGDGNPGISLKVSSTLASGVLYSCQRDWTNYDGTTPLSAPKFQVSITYNGEQIALGRAAGSPQAIESASAPSSDPSQHYAWFHKLDDGQATGSDADICAAVRTLKDTLVPEAAQ
jgi:hypothetical protein